MAGTATPPEALGADERARVAAAISAAELTTSGEIYCVVARRSGTYSQVPVLACALLAMVAPVALQLSGVRPDLVLATLAGGWTVAHDGGIDGFNAWMVVVIVALQVMLFSVLVLMVAWPGVADRLVLLRALRREAVHKAALDQFCAHGIAGTVGRTGVLIYVSLAERVAEIVADEAIHRSVNPASWSKIAAELAASARTGSLADGLVAAVTASGTLLATHFPPGPTNDDELPNRVVII
jgi:putative membrane protein